MLPISKINIDDQFENPLLQPYGLTFIVLDIDKDEKMVKLQSFNRSASENVGKPIWKRNTDRMFCEAWRVFNMENFIGGK